MHLTRLFMPMVTDRHLGLSVDSFRGEHGMASTATLYTRRLVQGTNTISVAVCKNLL